MCDYDNDIDPWAYDAAQWQDEPLPTRTTWRTPPFVWWRVTSYGTAIAEPDTPVVRALVDAGVGGPWFGSIEGAIINGGVRATAFHRKTHETYDAADWLRSGALVPTGSVTITTITAERE